MRHSYRVNPQNTFHLGPYVLKEPGVSILQENLYYSSALCVVYKILHQILPQLQKLQVHLTRGVDQSLTWGNDFISCLGHGASTGSMLRGMFERDVPLRNWKISYFLKLELCNLVNTFGCKIRAGDEELKKEKKQFYGPDWPKFGILGEILVKFC